MDFRGWGLAACAALMMPLKKALLDSSWLLFHRFSWISEDFMRFHEFHAFSWIYMYSCDFMNFKRFHGFHGSEVDFNDFMHLHGFWFISKHLAGWPGWLAAGCWLDGEEEGFKEVPHARRSGEVGGYSIYRIWRLGWLGWAGLAGWLFHRFL